MKIEELTDAIGAIDPKYVEEAERWRGAGVRRRCSRALLPLAACVCLALYGTYGLWNRGAQRSGESAGGAESIAEEKAEKPADAVPEMDGGAEGAAGEQTAGAASGGAGQDLYGEEAAGAASDAAGADREKEGSAKTESSAADRAGPDAAEPGDGAGQEAVGETQIRVNEVETLSGTIYDVAEPDHVEWLSAAELGQYYGTTVVPERLPAGLVSVEGGAEGSGTSAESGAACYAVAYDAQGRVVNDNNTLTFSDWDGVRSLKISVRTVEQAGEVIAFVDSGLEISLVNGREVTIGHYSGRDGEDCFLALSQVGGVRFTVRSVNLTEAELAEVLSGLL